ncbi:VOC family protein [Chryseosolibacter indicus]|uniref:VOC family protein n=1 Tax=Chryseosolibacter indicus TaxID=2782351 RepID=A0ABS5VZD0_9BACT|nr:VOC family protein [Chryseosolibacter indicus]MBT1706207.1 VOC family protein [Chryseosolibacter indicus]
MKGIEIVMLPVKDRKESKKFYEKLGFKTVTESQDIHGDPWIQVGFQDQPTTLSLAGFHGIICTTDNIEKEVEAIKAKGIEVGKIDVTPYGKFAWLKDPDGNGICLREAPVQ